MAGAKMKLPTIVSPTGIAAFAWLAKPDTGGKYSDDKYKVTLVLTKGDEEAEEFVSMINKAHDEARGRKNTDSPVKDGDEKNEDLKAKGKDIKEEFAGKYMMTFKSKFPAQLLAKGNVELTTETAPKSGDRVKVAFAMLPYAEGKNAGISLQMRAVKLIERRAGQDYSSAFGDDGDDADEGAESSGTETKSSGKPNKDF